MTGSYRLKREHHDVSIPLGSRRLAPAVTATGPGGEGVGSSISGRPQIEHPAGLRAEHPTEVSWNSQRG
jgi:hypothetical protein